MYHVVTMAGIGEIVDPATDHELFDGVVKHLAPSDYTVEPYVWRNEYGPTPRLDGAAYSVNLAESLPGLVNMVQLAQTEPVILMGYSGGAELLSLFLEGLARGAFPGVNVDNIALAVLVANPARASSDSNIGTADYGISGEHGPWPVQIRYLDIANRYDVICACPADSPLRDFAILTKNFSLIRPDLWGDIVLNWAIGELTARYSVGSWLQKLRLDRWVRAINDMMGYLSKEQHVYAYARQSYMIASKIMELAPPHSFTESVSQTPRM